MSIEEFITKRGKRIYVESEVLLASEALPNDPQKPDTGPRGSTLTSKPSGEQSEPIAETSALLKEAIEGIVEMIGDGAVAIKPDEIEVQANVGFKVKGALIPHYSVWLKQMQILLLSSSGSHDG